jgi:transposase
LVEAAHHACQPRSPDHELYLAVQQRCGTQRAILSVSRKLARRAYHTLAALELEAAA